MRWAAAEGWQPGDRDAELIRSIGSTVLIAATETEAIGGIAVTPWNPNFHFIGYYFILPEWRGRGHGAQLWDAAMRVIGSADAELNGVLAQIGRYESAGFRRRAVDLNVTGRLQSRPLAMDAEGLRIEPFSQSITPDVLALDEQINGDARIGYLTAWLSHEAVVTRVARRDSDGKVVGVISYRHGTDAWRIGPWYSQDVEVAEQLLHHAVTEIGSGSLVTAHVPELNQAAVDLCRSYGMVPRGETVRMRRGSFMGPRTPWVYGIVSPELG